MLKGLLIGFFCFILFIIMHVVVFRFPVEGKERFKLLKKVFFIQFFIYFLLYVLIPGNIVVLIPGDLELIPATIITLAKTLNFAVGIILYAFLFIGYCQFYFFIDRSISGRMMIELEGSPEKRLSAEEIKKCYPPGGIFTSRLKDIIESKCIVEDSGYYRNTKKGHRIAVISGFLKKFLKLEPGG